MMYDEEMGPLGKKFEKFKKKTLTAAQKWLC